MKLRSRFPSRQEILPVFSLVLFIVYSWTIFRMIYQVPSWLLSHTKHGLFNLAVYVFSFALFESLVLMSLVLLLSLLLPRSTFREHFVAHGSLVVFACTIWALAAQYLREDIKKSSTWEVVAYTILFMLSLFLISILTKYLLRRYNWIEAWIKALVERTTVLAWIYLPIGLISTLVVVVRNIF